MAGTNSKTIKSGCSKILSKSTLNFSNSDNSSKLPPLLYLTFYHIYADFFIFLKPLSLEIILFTNSGPNISERVLDLYATTK